MYYSVYIIIIQLLTLCLYRADARNALDYTIRIGSTPTFLYFDLYLY